MLIECKKKSAKDIQINRTYNTPIMSKIMIVGNTAFNEIQIPFDIYMSRFNLSYKMLQKCTIKCFSSSVALVNV